MIGIVGRRRVGRARINNDDIYYGILAQFGRKKKNLFGGVLFPPSPHYYYSSHDMAQKGVALLPPRSV